MTKEKKQKKPLKARLWKWCKVLLFTGAILITLGALVLAEENWRAERAWKKMQQEIADRGEPLTWAELVGPKVPDDENFAMSPLFEPIVGQSIDFPSVKPSDELPGIGVIAWSDPDAMKNARPNIPIDPGTRDDGQIDLEGWRQAFEDDEEFETPETPGDAAEDVLFALGKLDEKFVQITDASQRPGLRFIEDEESIYAGVPLSYLSILKNWAVALKVKASVQLTVRRSEQALENIRTAFRLGELLEQEPILISQLVKFSINYSAIIAFWQGWSDHRWSQEELQWFQDYFSTRDIRQIVPRTLIGERTISNVMPHEIPDGTGTSERKTFNIFAQLIMTQNKVATYRLYNLMIDDAKLSLESRTPLFQPYKDYLELAGMNRYHPYTAIATMLFPGVIQALEKFDRAQVTIDIAAAVCALERYWLDKNEYPEALASLVPEYLSEVPIDLMSGEPFHYSKRDDGWFDLYSVGMNQVDDDGFFATGRDNDDKIDYPWPLPIPQPEGRLF